MVVIYSEYELLIQSYIPGNSWIKYTLFGRDTVPFYHHKNNKASLDFFFFTSLFLSWLPFLSWRGLSSLFVNPSHLHNIMSWAHYNHKMKVNSEHLLPWATVFLLFSGLFRLTLFFGFGSYRSASFLNFWWSKRMLSLWCGKRLHIN